MEHEYWLLQHDPRQRDTFDRRAKEDDALGERLLALLGFKEDERSYLQLEAARLPNSRMV